MLSNRFFRVGQVVVKVTESSETENKGAIHVVESFDYASQTFKDGDITYACSDFLALASRQNIITGCAYQELAMRTNNLTHENATVIEMLDNAVYGISGEGGEVIDEIKKHKFQGHPLDVNSLLKECGDVLWYITEICYAVGATLDDVMIMNIKKLEERYPEHKFVANNSINRTDE